MSEDDPVIEVAGDVVELAENGVVEKKETLLGGERRKVLPYEAVTSIRVERRYSWVVLLVGAWFTFNGISVAFVDQVPIAVTWMVSAFGVLILIIAMLWRRETIEIETASDDITKKGRDIRPQLLEIAEAVEDRV